MRGVDLLLALEVLTELVAVPARSAKQPTAGPERRSCAVARLQCRAAALEEEYRSLIAAAIAEEPPPPPFPES